VLAFGVPGQLDRQLGDANEHGIDGGVDYVKAILDRAAKQGTMSEPPEKFGVVLLGRVRRRVSA
jgi:hypothetical protein